MDSCGIGELVGAHQRARREGRRLVVVRGEGTAIAQVLHTSALDKALETTTDPERLGVDETR
jgi:anti-anti-sigma regulatory factor